MESDPRRRRRRLLLAIPVVIVLLALVGVIGAYVYQRPLLLTGTGYAAHSDCAVVNVAGRTDPADDLPPNALVPYLRGSVDAEGASTTILGVLARQTAWHTPGYGCTLAAERPTFVGAPAPVDPADNLLTGQPEPQPYPAVADAVARAFGDDLAPEAKVTLGTRAVVVLHDGEVVAERYADGFTADTPQLGWSMAKSVTSLLTGRLVAEGRVALDDAALRPEWTDERRLITVDDLLRMTSGLTWDETYSLGTPVTRMLYTEPDMAAYAAGLPLAHPVGTVQQYSSGSTNILCRHLGERSGLGPDLPHDLLLRPLGLTSAVWEPDAAGTPVCSSYLWASPRDWAALGQFALDDGVWNGERLLPEGWMADTTTARAPQEPKGGGYAAGWQANRRADGTLVEPALPEDTYWAAGHDGQRLYVVPSERLVVVRLGFTPTLANPRTNTLVAELLANL